MNKLTYSLFICLWCCLLWGNCRATPDSTRLERDVQKAVKALNAQVLRNELLDEDQYIVDWQNYGQEGSELPATLLSETETFINENLKDLQDAEGNRIYFYVLISPPLTFSDVGDNKQEIIRFTQKVFNDSELGIKSAHQRGFLLNIDGIVNMGEDSTSVYELYYPAVAIGTQISVQSTQEAIEVLQAKGLTESFAGISQKKIKDYKNVFDFSLEGLNSRTKEYIRVFSGFLSGKTSDFFTPDASESDFYAELSKIEGILKDKFFEQLQTGATQGKSSQNENFYLDDQAGIFPPNHEFTLLNQYKNLQFQIMTTSEYSMYLNEGVIGTIRKGKTAIQRAYEIRSNNELEYNTVLIAMHIDWEKDAEGHYKEGGKIKTHWVVVISEDLEEIISGKDLRALWDNFTHPLLSAYDMGNSLANSISEYVGLLDYLKEVISQGLPKELVSLAGGKNTQTALVVGLTNGLLHQLREQKEPETLFRNPLGRIQLQLALMGMHYFSDHYQQKLGIDTYMDQLGKLLGTETEFKEKVDDIVRDIQENQDLILAYYDKVSEKITGKPLAEMAATYLEQGDLQGMKENLYDFGYFSGRFIITLLLHEEYQRFQQGNLNDFITEILQQASEKLFLPLPEAYKQALLDLGIQEEEIQRTYQELVEVLDLQTLEQHLYNFWDKHPALNRDELHALLGYTSDLFSEELENPGQDPPEYTQNIYNLLSSGWDKLPAVPGTAYKGFSVPNVTEFVQDVGTSLTLPSYLSAATQPQSNYWKTANVRWVIQGKTGKNIGEIALDPLLRTPEGKNLHLRKAAGYASEEGQEVLFKKGTGFYIARKGYTHRDTGEETSSTTPGAVYTLFLEEGDTPPAGEEEEEEKKLLMLHKVLQASARYFLEQDNAQTSTWSTSLVDNIEDHISEEQREVLTQLLTRQEFTTAAQCITKESIPETISEDCAKQLLVAYTDIVGKSSESIPSLYKLVYVEDYKKELEGILASEGTKEETKEKAKPMIQRLLEVGITIYIAKEIICEVANKSIPTNPWHLAVWALCQDFKRDFDPDYDDGEPDTDEEDKEGCLKDYTRYLSTSIWTRYDVLSKITEARVVTETDATGTPTVCTKVGEGKLNQENFLQLSTYASPLTSTGLQTSTVLDALYERAGNPAQETSPEVLPEVQGIVTTWTTQKDSKSLQAFNAHPEKTEKPEKAIQETSFGGWATQKFPSIHIMEQNKDGSGKTTSLTIRFDTQEGECDSPLASKLVNTFPPLECELAQKVVDRNKDNNSVQELLADQKLMDQVNALEEELKLALFGDFSESEGLLTEMVREKDLIISWEWLSVDVALRTNLIYLQALFDAKARIKEENFKQCLESLSAVDARKELMNALQKANDLMRDRPQQTNIHYRFAANATDIAFLEKPEAEQAITQLSKNIHQEYTLRFSMMEIGEDAEVIARKGTTPDAIAESLGNELQKLGVDITFLQREWMKKIQITSITFADKGVNLEDFNYVQKWQDANPNKYQGIMGFTGVVEPVSGKIFLYPSLGSNTSSGERREEIFDANTPKNLSSVDEVMSRSGGHSNVRRRVHKSLGYDAVCNSTDKMYFPFHIEWNFKTRTLQMGFISNNLTDKKFRLLVKKPGSLYTLVVIYQDIILQALEKKYKNTYFGGKPIANTVNKKPEKW